MIILFMSHYSRHHHQHVENLDWILIAVTSNNVRLEISSWAIEETHPLQRNVRINGEEQGGWTCEELKKWCRKNRIALSTQHWFY